MTSSFREGTSGVKGDQGEADVPGAFMRLGELWWKDAFQKVNRISDDRMLRRYELAGLRSLRIGDRHAFRSDNWFDVLEKLNGQPPPAYEPKNKAKPKKRR